MEMPYKPESKPPAKTKPESEPPVESKLKSAPVRETIAVADIMDVAEVIALEQKLAAEGTSLFSLMKLAGASLAYVATLLLDNAETPTIAVAAGSGNNGGDGWIAAHILAHAGAKVCVVSTVEPAQIHASPASLAVANTLQEGLFKVAVSPDQPKLKEIFDSSDLIIDCLLGTGFSFQSVREPALTIIRAINDCQNASVLCCDVPSGLDAQTGNTADVCVKGDATCTMLAVKRGLVELHKTAEISLASNAAPPYTVLGRPEVGKLYLAPLVQ